VASPDGKPFRNSLLLGKLAYQIRKGTGVNIPVATLFTNSTVQAMASLIDASGQKQSSLASLGATLHRKTQSEATLIPQSGFDDHSLPAYSEYSYPDDPRVHRENSRGQNHPVSLIVQAFPFVLFYPLKAAFTCRLICSVTASGLYY
jgi:hypothetical protein